MSALNKTVGTLIKSKAVPVTEAGRSVAKAIEIMESCASNAIGVTVSGHFTGLFTEGDLIKKVVRKELDPKEVKLYEVMTVNPLTITRDCGVGEAFFYICKYNYSSLPVAENGRFYGIVSEQALRREIAQSLRQITAENNMLMSYIKGETYGLCAG